MSTLTTLFGGLAAVFILYGLGGAIRGLPSVLRAALAGLLPLLGYFAFIVGRWPGLDVVAMHISVFLAAGLVLFALNQFRRRSPGRMHWAPKLLTAFFMALVLLNGGLLYIATKGLPDAVGRWWLGSKGSAAVHSGFSGVVAHDQAAAKAISSELSQAQSQLALGWQVDITGLDRVEKPERSIRLRVKDRTGLPIDGLDVQLHLLRPGAAEATALFPLTPLGAGSYGGELRLPANGRWLVEFRLVRDRETLYQLIREVVAP